jgi:hypothetical protein
VKLRELIRQIADDNPTATPNEIVDKVVDQTSDDDIREFFRTAVRNDVLDVLRVDRNAAMVEALSEQTPSRPVRRTPNKSSKVEGIRSAWQMFLAGRVRVADGYKLVGDCTLADVEFILKYRAGLVADIEALSAKWRTQVRDRMLALGVDRVRDLPEPEAAA